MTLMQQVEASQAESQSITAKLSQMYQDSTPQQQKDEELERNLATKLQKSIDKRQESRTPTYDRHTAKEFKNFEDSESDAKPDCKPSSESEHGFDEVEASFPEMKKSLSVAVNRGDRAETNHEIPGMPAFLSAHIATKRNVQTNASFDDIESSHSDRPVQTEHRKSESGEAARSQRVERRTHSISSPSPISNFVSSENGDTFQLSESIISRPVEDPKLQADESESDMTNPFYDE